MSEESKKVKIAAYTKKYHQTEKGKQAMKRAILKYQHSEKGKEVAKRSAKRYRKSEKGIEANERAKKIVKPCQAKNDFFNRFPAYKFRSKEDFYRVVKIYSENVCSIEGLCEQIQSEILLKSKKISSYNNLETEIERKKRRKAYGFRELEYNTT